MTTTEFPLSVQQAIRDRRATRSFLPTKVLKHRITALLIPNCCAASMNLPKSTGLHTKLLGPRS